MKNLLITGGSGYIGSHTLLEIAKTGEYKITVFDNLKNGNKKAVEIIKEHTKSDIELVEGELLNKSDLEKLFSSHKFDSVIHFAALIEAGVSVVFPSRFYENNVMGTLNLIMEMQKNDVRNIVFSSTAAVYGTPKTDQVNEEYETNPESPYGESKLMVEQILRSLATKNVDPSQKINSVILRYFNAAGSNPDLLIGQDYPNPTHLITVAIEAALGMREKLTVFGNDYPTKDGTCVRDYIHVEDLAKGHVAALKYLESHEGTDVFNLGTNKGTSNMDVIKELEKIQGKFNYEFGPRRPGDPVAYYADNSKAIKTLGWKPQYGLEEIVKTAYEWKKKYPHGYESR